MRRSTCQRVCETQGCGKDCRSDEAHTCPIIDCAGCDSRLCFECFVDKDTHGCKNEIKRVEEDREIWKGKQEA